MATIEGKPKLTAEITIRLSEEEAGALDALCGYGVNSFLSVFYKYMGEAYLKPYEKGLRSLFDSVRSDDTGISSFLERVREARKVFAK